MAEALSDNLERWVKKSGVVKPRELNKIKKNALTEKDEMKMIKKERKLQKKREKQLKKLEKRQKKDEPKSKPKKYEESESKNEHISGTRTSSAISSDLLNPDLETEEDHTPLKDDEILRVKQMFRIEEGTKLLRQSSCYINTVTNQSSMVHKKGTICLFENYLTFCEHVPSRMKQSTIKEGYLDKLSRKRSHSAVIFKLKKWKRFYFTLDHDKLTFYDTEEDKDNYTIHGVIPLLDIHSLFRSKNDDTSRVSFEVLTSERSYLLSCTSLQEATEWTDRIEEAIMKRRSEAAGGYTPFSNVTVLIPLKYVKKMQKMTSVLYPNGISVTTKRSEFVFSNFVNHNKMKDFYKKLHSEWNVSLKLHKKDKQQSSSGEDSPSVNVVEDLTKEEITDPPSVMSDLEDDEIEDGTRRSSESEKLHFHRRFHLPETEELLAVFSCAMLRSILVQGKMYISQNYVCFYARNLGIQRVVVIPFRDVVKIEKQKFHAHWLVKSIVITTFEREFHFGSFINRKGALEILQTRMRAAHSGSWRKSKVMVAYDEETFGVSDFERPPKNLRISMLLIGTRGDVQPYIALSRALIGHGHHVRMVTHEAHKPLVEEYGIEFKPLAGDPNLLLKLCTDNERILSIKFARECVQFYGFFDEFFKTAWDGLKDAESDVILQNPAAMIGIHIAEKLKVPFMLSFTMPFTRTTQIPHPFAYSKVSMGPFYNYSTYIALEQAIFLSLHAKINTFRKHTLGLPPIDASQSASLPYDRRVPTIYCWSPSVIPRPTDWADNIALTGYWFLHSPEDVSDYVPSPELQEFLSKKPAPIYIGFGSVTVDKPDKLTKRILKALEASDQRALIYKTWGGSIDLNEYKDRVLLVKSVPHTWLFPRVSAVVHHGGAGTTAEGLRWGKPTLIVPFFGDQHMWAHKIEELGVGPPALTLKKLNTAKLTSAFIKITTDKEMKERAEALGERIRSQDGIGRAIEFFYRQLRRMSYTH